MCIRDRRGEGRAEARAAAALERREPAPGGAGDQRRAAPAHQQGVEAPGRRQRGRRQRTVSYSPAATPGVTHAAIASALSTTAAMCAGFTVLLSGLC